MKLSLRVDVNGEYGSWSACKEIPELYRREFVCHATCDDPSLVYLTGEKLMSSIADETVVKARKDAAEILARELADFIVAAMERGDTHNGYAKKS